MVTIGGRYSSTADITFGLDFQWLKRSPTWITTGWEEYSQMPLSHLNFRIWVSQKLSTRQGGWPSSAWISPTIIASGGLEFVGTGFSCLQGLIFTLERWISAYQAVGIRMGEVPLAIIKVSKDMVGMIWIGHYCFPPLPQIGHRSFIRVLNSFSAAFNSLLA